MNNQKITDRNFFKKLNPWKSLNNSHIVYNTDFLATVWLFMLGVVVEFIGLACIAGFKG